MTNFQAIILGSDQGRNVYSKKLVSFSREIINLNQKGRFHVYTAKEMPLAYSMWLI